MTLELFEVTKARGRGRQRLDVLMEVSLTVRSGELVLLEGPSGSGKTTLLTVAAGLLTPDGGEVWLAGERLDRMSAEQRRAWRARRVGFVFQRANLLDSLNVFDNVLLAAAIAGVPREEAARETSRLLEALGIGDLERRDPAELSGGEEHRVAVARALVHRPAVIFADEPTGSLDATSGRAVAEALSSLSRARGVAVLVATHDPRLRPFATRVVVLRDGAIGAEAA